MIAIRPMLAVAAAALLLPTGLAGTAAASSSAATGVHLVSHVAHAKGGGGGVVETQEWTVVTKVTGVTAAVSHKIAWDINRRTVRAVIPPAPWTTGTFSFIDVVAEVRADSRYLTVDQKTYEYVGGAHGESANVPLTYAIASGKLLTLRSFAAKGRLGQLLKVLSFQSRKALRARGISADFYDLGTTPVYANFALFEPLTKGLRIEFPQGDVADEAHGPLHVTVSWAALHGLIGLPLPA